jgi:hypothetical protein
METPKELLEEARGRAEGDPMSISIRQLLGHWGAKRRGYWVVLRIERDLSEYGLTTTPPFTDGWIDNEVELVPAPETEQRDEDLDDNGSPASELTTRAMLRVGDLASAHREVTSVDLSGDLQLAQSLMLRYDYSQIAVMSGERSLRGALTWESIAVAHLRDHDASVRDAMVHAEPVAQDRDLLDLIPFVVQEGFVFVEAPNNSLSGIITMADLSLEFSNLATPYFLLGEIERRLRRILDEKMPLTVLEGAVAPGDLGRTVESAQDLTFGGYVRVLENPVNWDLLGWAVDRKTFIEALSEVKDHRNDVMHFSPDPFGEDELEVLRNFIKWLRILDPRP